jgi:hypothetical protein
MVKRACQLVAIEVPKVLLTMFALVVLRVQGLAAIGLGQDTFIIDGIVNPFLCDKLGGKSEK